MVTFLKYLPATPGQRYSSSPLNSFSHLIGLSNVPGILFIRAFSFNVPNPAAAKSLAIPLIDKQSPLFGVIFISMTGSSRLNTSINFSPSLYFASTSIIPSCSSDIPISLSETSIPQDSTPRILDFFNFTPVPGIKLFSGAKIPFIPVRAFGAPQTT